MPKVQFYSAAVAAKATIPSFIDFHVRIGILVKMMNIKHNIPLYLSFYVSSIVQSVCSIFLWCSMCVFVTWCSSNISLHSHEFQVISVIVKYWANVDRSECVVSKKDFTEGNKTIQKICRFIARNHLNFCCMVRKFNNNVNLK